MRLYIFLITLIINLVPSKAAAQGLAFQNPIEIGNRTSYTVFFEKAPSLRKRMAIDFDMQFPYDDAVGYIFRIKEKPGNLIFNMFYDGRGNDYFELNEEGHKSLMKNRFNKQEMKEKLWFHISVVFDSERKLITLSVDGKETKASFTRLPGTFVPDIVFGRSEFLVDVPAFKIRNLVVSDAEKSFSFPLNHTHGTAVFSTDGEKMGHVVNPYWMINDSYHWKHVNTIKSKSGAGAFFNMAKHDFYCYNHDTLFIYDITTEKMKAMRFNNKCPLDIRLGMNFYDEDEQRLYAYEAFKEHKTEKEASVASFSPDDMTWRYESDAQINEGQMHHHAGFYDKKHRQLTIYGGFAAMKYSNTFYSYLVKEHRWLMRHEITGKRMPRYFTCAGYDGKRYAYLFGGMGNESGDQTVGQKYYYDLHRLDLRNNKLEKIRNFNFRGDKHVVPVRSMIIDGDCFYTLCYSQFLSDAFLKLYRFNIKDGTYEQLGDSFLIRSDRIETNANLYYDAKRHKMIAAVQQYTNDSSSVLNIYTIDTPVLTEKQYSEAAVNPTERSKWIFAVIIICLAVTITALTMRRRKDNEEYEEAFAAATEDEYVPETRRNAIYLFGNFTARDKNDKDISYLFTDKLKQVLCLIIQNHKNDGISSKLLGNIMWGDKPAENIKNLRSVTINHLRKMLSDIEGVKVIYANNKFKLETDDSFYCDFLQLVKLNEKEPDESTEAEITDILKRGKFLNKLDMPTLDSFKADTERWILMFAEQMMAKAYDNGNYQNAILYSDIIHHADPFNEKAIEIKVKSLRKMNRVTESKQAMHTFSENYFRTFGENYVAKE